MRRSFPKIFSKTACPITADFHLEPHWEGAMNAYLNGLGHLTSIAFMTFKDLLLQNQKFYNLESCNAASGTQALQNVKFKKVGPGLNLIYCTTMSKLEAYVCESEKLLQRHRAANNKIDRRFMVMKHFDPGRKGVVYYSNFDKHKCTYFHWAQCNEPTTLTLGNLRC